MDQEDCESSPDDCEGNAEVVSFLLRIPGNRNGKKEMVLSERSE